MAAKDDKAREADEVDDDVEESASEGGEGASEDDDEAASESDEAASEDDEAASKGDDDASEDDEAASKDDDDAEEDDEAASKDDDGASDGDEEADEEAEEADDAAPRIAEALGVGVESAEEKPADEEEVPVPNRAARRREEAVERRRKRRGEPLKGKAASASEAKDDDDLPKDKNARAKELLLRRREEAGRRGKVGANLLPGEMVDDALARTTSAAGKWIRNNFNIIQWVVVAALVGGGVFLYLNYREEKKVANASSDLAGAVAAERGVVMEEDKRSDEEKDFDTTRVFKTPEERADTALASYNKVIDQSEGAGAAILAKLGQAGIYLEKREWQPALEAYMVVAVSPLAAADPDVKGRALEGAGFAKEGKADLDGALQSFKELEGIDARGYKELAMYHQARIYVAKGDKEKAKELLKAAREKLTTPSTDGVKSAQFTEAVVDETLRRLDPSAVPAKTQLTGGPKGNSLTPEEIQRMFQKAQDEAAKKKAADPHEEH